MRNFNSTVNLSAVTTATTGSSILAEKTDAYTALVNVSVNTGAVTVTIEGSLDGSTWYTLNATTWTATTGTSAYHYSLTPFKYIRSKTTTQSNSTVTVTFLTASGVGLI